MTKIPEFYRRIKFVLICVGLASCFLGIYFPHIFVVSYGSPTAHPRLSFYILAVLVFISEFAFTNIELAVLGFRQSSILSIMISLLPSLSMTTMLTLYLFMSYFFSIGAYETEVWSIAPYIVMSLMVLCFLCCVVVTVLLEVYIRKRTSKQ